MANRELPPYEDSFSPEKYIPLLDPKLLTQVQSLSGNEQGRFWLDFKRTYHMIAHDMVRYAIANQGSYSSENGQEIINPATNQPFTLAELKFEAEKLVGDTAGSFIRRDKERVQHIPLIALALYWAVNK